MCWLVFPPLSLSLSGCSSSSSRIGGRQCETPTQLGWFVEVYSQWWKNPVSQPVQEALRLLLPLLLLCSIRLVFSCFPSLSHFSFPKNSMQGGSGGAFQEALKIWISKLLFPVIHIPGLISLFTECATAVVPPTKWLVRGLFFSLKFLLLFELWIQEQSILYLDTRNAQD